MGTLHVPPIPAMSLMATVTAMEGYLVTGMVPGDGDAALSAPILIPTEAVTKQR